MTKEKHECVCGEINSRNCPVHQQEKPLSEFRQFWIYYFSSGRAQISTSVVTLDDEYISEPNQTRGIKPTEVKHVIEYAAVAEVTKRERERALILLNQLKNCRAAMKYAHEDRVDQYYLNVFNDIEARIEAYQKSIEGDE